jgi:hypothetical protein
MWRYFRRSSMVTLLYFMDIVLSRNIVI